MLVTAAVLGTAGVAMTISGATMGATIAGLDISKNMIGSMIKHLPDQAFPEGKASWDEDWDEIEMLDTEKSETDDKVYLADDISSMEISLSADQLELKEYEGDSVRIEVTGSGQNKIRAGKDEDTLVIEGIGRFSNRQILLQYPRNMKFDETSIKIAAGTVSLEDDFETDDLDISVGAGELTNRGNIRAEDTEVEVGTGNVELRNLKVNDFEGECGIGNLSVDMKDREENYNYEISCGAGAVQIGNSSYEGLGHEKKITNPDAEGNMKLDCGIGNINVHFEEA